jgi:ABC-2 type transport system ATP-binding protein
LSRIKSRVSPAYAGLTPDLMETKPLSEVGKTACNCIGFTLKFNRISKSIIYSVKMKTIISVKDLKKNYGKFEAVKGISFDVYEGEIFGLLGPNGAGKSTTLEIIETLRDKTSGKIIVDGLDLDRDAAQIKKIIGVQLQTSGFYPGLNLLELIDLFCGLYNTKTDPTKLLEMVNLKDKAKNKYKEMSGGQKQRFSIATTLINKPKIIFLDEPTTGLDPQARRNLWDLIQRIRKEGTTVIITTHYMDEAEYLCDRVAIMDEGKIIALQSPDKLIDDLVASGFERPKETKSANLEDVFINLTGKDFRED